MTEPKYKAFISYHHDSDERFAASLQSSLSRFAEPWYRLRSMRIFRDETSLAADPALWHSIEQALGESEYFLLLACPASAGSRWVQQETMTGTNCDNCRASFKPMIRIGADGSLRKILDTGCAAAGISSGIGFFAIAPITLSP